MAVPPKRTDIDAEWTVPVVHTIDKARFDQFFAASDMGDDSSAATYSHHPTTEDAVDSVYSYRSDRDISQFVKTHFGRTFNALNNMYVLPSDESEWKRLDRQNSAFSIGFGHPSPCPEVVEALLAPAENETKRVLDIGCGTGSWALEMARRFPHAQVRGIDVAPIPFDTSLFPPNIVFEIDDVNNGLTHFHGQYDLIHLRLVRSGFKDLPTVFEDIEMCLKPGGVMLIIETDPCFKNENFETLKLARVEGDEKDADGVSEEGSWLVRMHQENFVASGLAGSDTETSFEYIEKGFWDHPLMDPNTAVSGSLYLPVGTWARANDPGESQSLQYVGELMRQSMMRVHTAWHAFLLRFGLTQETLDQWSAQAQRQLEAQQPKLLIRMSIHWARRRSQDGGPAPPLPTVYTQPGQGNADEDDIRPIRFTYPFFETFESAEQAAIAKAKRDASAGKLPTPAVKRAYAAMQNQSNV